MSEGDSPAKALETGLEEDLIPAVEDASTAVENAVKSVGTGTEGAATRFEMVEAGNTSRFTQEVESGEKTDLDTVSTETRQAARTIAPKSQITSILGDSEESAVAESATEDRQALLDELSQNGVKHDPDAVVRIGRGKDGQIKFLETGNDKAGLQHLMKHAPEFEEEGISAEELPDYTMTAATKGEVVGYQGKGKGRPIVEFEYGGQTRRVALSVGNNGFVVGGNPVGFKGEEG